MPRKHRVRFWIALISLTLCASVSHGQTGWSDDEPVDTYRSSSRGDGYDSGPGWGTRLGLGFTAGHDTFLVDLAVPYSTGSGTSFGPRVQLGLDDKRQFIAPTIDLEYAHDLTQQVDGPLGRVRPLIHAGLGVAWLEEDGRRGADDDWGFLVHVGVGAAYPLSRNFAVASVVDFNIMPADVLDENFVFSWQVVQLRVSF